MYVFSDKHFCDFLRRSLTNISIHGFTENYYHTLASDDEKPVVIHHSTAQCTVVLSGNGTVILDGMKYHVQANDIILIDAGVTHQFLANTKLSLFHIHLPFETMDSDREVISGNDYIPHL